MRYPRTLAAAVFALAVIAWAVVAERLLEIPLRIEASRTGAAAPTSNRSQSAALICGQSGDNEGTPSRKRGERFGHCFEWLTRSVDFPPSLFRDCSRRRS